MRIPKSRNTYESARIRNWEMGGTHVFPTQPFPALAAVDVTDRVVAGGHLAVDRLTLDNVDAMAMSTERTNTD